MLIASSLLIIMFYTIYYRIKVYPHSKLISAMVGKSISMALEMASSFSIGLFLGILLQGQLAFSTIGSILLSFLICITISYPFGLLACFEGLFSSSLMGSTMGAMLGEMIPVNHTTLMIVTMDIIYLLMISFIVMMIHREIRKKEIFQTIEFQLNPFFTTILIPCLIIGIATIFDIHHKENKSTMNLQEHHTHMKMDH